MGVVAHHRKRGFWIRRIKCRWTTKPVKIQNSSTYAGEPVESATTSKSNERRERGTKKRSDVCWNYGRAEILSLTSLCPSWFHGVLHGSRNFFARVTKNCHARPPRGRWIKAVLSGAPYIKCTRTSAFIISRWRKPSVWGGKKEGGNGSREVNSRCGGSVLNAKTVTRDKGWVVEWFLGWLDRCLIVFFRYIYKSDINRDSCFRFCLNEINLSKTMYVYSKKSDIICY